MRLLIILQADKLSDVGHEIKRLKRDLSRICLPVNFVEQYSGLTTDVEVVMTAFKVTPNPEQNKLLEQCDLAISYSCHPIYETFKVVKDKKKPVVRDVTEQSFYAMIGKYYAFDYAELIQNEQNSN